MSDHEQIAQLAPSPVWSAFVQLNAIPRASKQEAAITKFVAYWGQRCNLPTSTDRWGNVLIRKPASPGYEDHPTVVLQSHLDMVHQKNATTQFDFATQGIQMFIEGDWVRARGTTLGADNGIGVATMLSTLAANDQVHPPLECLFTIDEETGMSGAKQLDPSWLRGHVLLNLDTEQDHELTIGCAGGADVTCKSDYIAEPVPKGHAVLQVHVSGLTGGHSGVDIHLGRANANKVMNRILSRASALFGLRVASIDGGSLRNAIPRESTAIVAVPRKQLEPMKAWLDQETRVIQSENAVTDPQLAIACQEGPRATGVLPVGEQTMLMGVLSGTISGIARMSPSIAGLVQTSNNLARVLVDQGEISIQCLARSSVDSEREELSRSLASVLGLLGLVTTAGEYPGWTPQPGSNIVKTMSRIYEQMHGSPPHVAACHAGLECGIIGGKFPGMEMISFGPTILGAHSPDERVQISSVQKFHRYYLETLRQL
jgi:dipeptidase D